MMLGGAAGGPPGSRGSCLALPPFARRNMHAWLTDRHDCLGRTHRGASAIGLARWCAATAATSPVVAAPAAGRAAAAAHIKQRRASDPDRRWRPAVRAVVCALGFARARSDLTCVRPVSHARRRAVGPSVPPPSRGSSSSVPLFTVGRADLLAQRPPPESASYVSVLCCGRCAGVHR